ncbi:Probable polygalacturonase [Linum grandiflorum]
MQLVGVLLVLAFLSVAPWAVTVNGGSPYCRRATPDVIRPHSVTITEFGAVGDGVTLNTKAFQNAIFYLNSFADKGGAKLYVPSGRWLTGSFDLISHLTIWLDEDAVILGSKDSNDWPVVDPLPSYGRGRELPGKRHRSLIYGSNLTDVIITGNNGTIDGQGDVWWNWFHNKTLNYTRPHLVELINSTDVIISNLTFQNSPFWTIHPVYCRHISSMEFITYKLQLIPTFSHAFPDSSDDVCIEDCYISTGDDLIAIKSGWDEYGISFNRPSKNITIRRLVGRSRSSAGIAIGSEMSGGVSEIYAQDLHFFGTNSAIRIKTSPGRGGYVRNIHISNMTLTDVNVTIRLTGQYGEHPDESYDPSALPSINKITIENVRGVNITHAGVLEGIEGDPFVDICLLNISLSVGSKPPWECTHIAGYSDMVTPKTCKLLREDIFPDHSSDCYHVSQSFLQNSSSLSRGKQWFSW